MSRLLISNQETFGTSSSVVTLGFYDSIQPIAPNDEEGG